MVRARRPALLGFAAAAAWLLAAPRARGDESLSPVSEAGVVRPPPLGHAYLQYGVAFTVENVASAGPICAAPN
ncbi:MAG: hypothetical protein FWD17_05890, partial [Polyangiaceae bacterium]|nr:hypothetical protein [Polyangiaceae bacterium]